MSKDALENPFLRHKSSEVTANFKLNEPFYGFRPYAPQKREYALELGSMWEEASLYWVGANAGFHLGRCVFTKSETCQNYFDVVAGVGGRDGLTNGMLLAGIKWQFINWPKYVSPSVGIYVGVLNIRDNKRDETPFTYALSYALATSVHKRMDLKWETRLGVGDQVWAQTFISFSLKVDRWVTYFGNKLKGVGTGTFDMTKKILKTTVDGAEAAVKKVTPK